MVLADLDATADRALPYIGTKNQQFTVVSWDERFRDGNGSERVLLAERGYEVDAIDQSRVGLEIAPRNASTRGVEERCNWIHADATAFDYPAAEYDVITLSFFRTLDRLPGIKSALAADGVLFYHPTSGRPIRSTSARSPTATGSRRTNCSTPASI